MQGEGGRFQQFGQLRDGGSERRATGSGTRSKYHFAGHEPTLAIEAFSRSHGPGFSQNAEVRGPARRTGDCGLCRGRRASSGLRARGRRSDPNLGDGRFGMYGRRRFGRGDGLTVSSCSAHFAPSRRSIAMYRAAFVRPERTANPRAAAFRANSRAIFGIANRATLCREGTETLSILRR